MKIFTPEIKKSRKSEKFRPCEVGPHNNIDYEKVQIEVPGCPQGIKINGNEVLDLGKGLVNPMGAQDPLRYRFWGVNFSNFWGGIPPITMRGVPPRPGSEFRGGLPPPIKSGGDVSNGCHVGVV